MSHFKQFVLGIVHLEDTRPQKMVPYLLYLGIFSQITRCWQIFGDSQGSWETGPRNTEDDELPQKRKERNSFQEKLVRFWFLQRLHGIKSWLVQRTLAGNVFSKERCVHSRRGHPGNPGDGLGAWVGCSWSPRKGERRGWEGFNGVGWGGVITFSLSSSLWKEREKRWWRLRTSQGQRAVT